MPKNPQKQLEKKEEKYDVGEWKCAMCGSNNLHILIHKIDSEYSALDVVCADESCREVQRKTLASTMGEDDEDNDFIPVLISIKVPNNMWTEADSESWTN